MCLLGLCVIFILFCCEVMLDRRIIGVFDGKIVGDDDGNENNNYYVYLYYYLFVFNLCV